MSFLGSSRACLLTLSGIGASLFIILSIFFASDDIRAQSSSHLKWYNSPKVMFDCRVSCGEIGGSPVRTGYYTMANGPDSNDFFVCGVDKASSGWRPGYNLEGEAVCTAGTEGDTVQARNKACLCTTAGYEEVVSLVPAKWFADCNDTCGYSAPVSAGTGNSDEYEGASYNVCATNPSGYGWRPGYNLAGTRGCTTALDGEEAYDGRHSLKYCLCKKLVRRSQ